MKIDKKLNIVIPVVPDDGLTYYVHAMPIAREVFEQNFVLINAAYAETISNGMTGPRNASLFLQRVASETKQEDAAQALVNEMRRLANVLVPGENGYELLPWQQAVERQLFDEDDSREVDNVLCFFMLAWHMHRKSELGVAMTMLEVIGVGQSTHSTPMVFAASLTTSTAGVTSAPSTPPAPQSSVPH